MEKAIRRCANCRERQVARVTEDYAVTIEHDGKSFDLTLPGLPLLKCIACGARILDDDADHRVSAALRAAAGLLQPEEIRAKRHAQSLTLQQLADRLGFPEAILSRWESGAQIQQHFVDRMLRAYFDVPQLREYLDSSLAATA